MLKLLLLIIFPVIIFAENTSSLNLKIGVLSGLSGAAAKWNTYQNMGVELAREELAKAGHQLELIYEDSATKATQAIAAYRKLVKFNQVDALLFNDFGFVVTPLIPLSAADKKLIIAMSVLDESHCSLSNYFYPVTSRVKNSASAFARIKDLFPETKTVAIFTFEDPEWGDTYLNIWQGLAKENNWKVLHTFRSNDFLPDYKPALTKLITNQPDLIFLAHESESFLKTARQFGIKSKIISANNILEILADEKRNNQIMEGVYVARPKITDEFREKFKKRYQKEPILEAYTGYESLQTLVRAFQNNPQKPAEGIKQVRYQGVAGMIDFTKGKCFGNETVWDLFIYKNNQFLALQ